MKQAATALLLFLSTTLPAQVFPTKIGVGLDGIGGSALELPNATLTATAWQSVANSGSNATTDALGWPTEDFRVVFFDHRPFNAWNNAPDDPQRYVVDQSGTYTLSFKGQATLTSWSDAPIVFQNQAYSAATNTTMVNIVFPPGGGPNSGVIGNYGFLMVNFLQTNYATPQQVVAAMSANSDGNVTRIQTLAEYANQWQLKHLQYEGGPDNGGGSTTNIANRISANRLPEMKTAVIHHYKDNWFSANANGTAPVGTNDVVNYFVMSGGVSRYGCWGATEDLKYLQNLAQAPKYDALCALTGLCGNEPSISLTAPVNNATVPVNTIVNLTANASIKRIIV